MDISNNDGFEICIRPNWATAEADHSLTFKKGGDFPERSILVEDDIISNESKSKTMYLLHKDKGVTTTFKVVDSADSAVQGAKVAAFRTINESTQQLDFEFTDGAGQARLFLDPNELITIKVSKKGFTTLTTSIFPTNSEAFTVTLSPITSETIINGTGVIYSFYPDFSPLNNDTVYPFQFNMTSTFFDITSCSLFIQDENNTILKKSSTSFTSTTCDINISFNTSAYSKLVSNATYTINNSNFSQSRDYFVFSTYQGQFSLKTVVDDLTSFSAGGFNDRTRLLLAFAFILLLMGFATRFAGLTNPEGGYCLVDILSVVLFIY